MGSATTTPKRIRLSVGAKLFVFALALVCAGGIALWIGISAAFGRAGNWSNELAEIGIFLLVCGGAINLVAALVGVVRAVRDRRMRWWLPWSVIVVAVSIWCGWIAIHL